VFKPRNLRIGSIEVVGSGEEARVELLTKWLEERGGRLITARVYGFHDTHAPSLEEFEQAFAPLQLGDGYIRYSSALGYIDWEMCSVPDTRTRRGIEIITVPADEYKKPNPPSGMRDR
jgi:hypothetical protein